MYRLAGVLVIAFIHVLSISTGQQADCRKPVTFNEAWRCCQSGGSTFAPYTVLSYDDQVGLLANLREKNYESAWINLKRNNFKEWRWTDNSVSGISTVMAPPAECGKANMQTRHLEVTPCAGNTTGILCQRKACKSCASLGPKSSSCFHADNTCFIFSCGTSNWYSGRSYCHRKGWELAVMKDDTVIKKFRAKDWHGADAVCKSAWIGLHRVDWFPVASEVYPKEVFWLDLEPSTSGNCTIIMRVNGEFYWKSSPCDVKHHVICKASSVGVGISTTQKQTNTANGSRQLRKVLVPVLVTVGILVAVVIGLLFAWKYRRRTCARKQYDTTSLKEPNGIEVESTGPAHTETEIDNVINREETDTETAHLLRATFSTQVSIDKTSHMIAKILLERYSRLSLWKWGDDFPSVNIEGLYIKTSWIDRTGGMTDHEDRELEHYTEMFELGPSPSDTNRILVYGEPGTGKTTFCKRLLVDWANTKLQNDDASLNEERRRRLDKYSYVIPIILREVEQNATLKETIGDQLSILEEDLDELWELIKIQKDKTLYLLDGFDEYRPSTSDEITRLLTGKTFITANKIIACRPHVQSSVAAGGWNVKAKVEILGFSEDSVKAYISKFFGKDSEEGISLYNNISQDPDFAQVKEISHFPSILLLVCLIWREKGRIGRKLSDFFIEYIKYNCGRWEGKEKPQDKRTPASTILDRYGEQLLKLGKVCLEAAKTMPSTQLFSYERLRNDIGQDAWNFGFLKVYKSSEGKQIAEFHHRTLLEFFAAYYIVNTENGPEHLRDMPYQKTMVFRLVQQLCEDLNDGEKKTKIAQICTEKLAENQQQK